MRPIYPLLFISLLMFATPASALRCGNKIVKDGDPAAKVRKICGEPASIQYRTIYRGGVPRSLARQTTVNGIRTSSDSELLIHRRSVVEVIVEEWTYNFGPRRLMRMVRFENGLVTGVSQLGYGYRE